MLWSPISDCTDRLLPAEHQAVARAVPRRQQEFATGRVLAREAMVELSVSPRAIPAGSQRQPLWPEGLLGSISHSRDFACAVVARSGTGLLGIGADLERFGRLDPKLHERLFSAAEQRRIEQFGPEFGTALFSAKEAVYKAVFPTGQKYIGFKEVEVLPSADGRRFRMRYLGDHEPNRVMETGLGQLLHLADHMLALFAVPAAR